MQEFKKTKEKSQRNEIAVEQKSVIQEMPKTLEQADSNLAQLREQEATNVEIGKVELGSVGDVVDETYATEVEDNKEEERLKQEVQDFFRKIILNSNEPERQEIESALRKIAVENEVKFDEIIDESYKLRDSIVKMIQSKKFDSSILGKIEKWLGLIFPKSKEFCKQASFRLANEIKEHWELA